LTRTGNRLDEAPRLAQPTAENRCLGSREVHRAFTFYSIR
jgi:hypothetical protein